MKTITPPIKCQGIKTKLIPSIKEISPTDITGTWVEPFCGSGVVALNVQPQRALLADTNVHIITLYSNIQKGIITPSLTKNFLIQEGEKLSKRGDEYYYEVRTRFNENHDPLDFLFLNRACFNGVMRFNQKGKFNVPFCHKPNRFSQSYITKITNQIKNLSEVMYNKDWRFEVLDFHQTLSQISKDDFVYVDPPYAGRHVDYFNSWSDKDENELVQLIKNLPCKFLLSTWHSNEYRENKLFQQNWQVEGFFSKTFEHFYHVGSTEELRNAMTEALITNYNIATENTPAIPQPQLLQYSLPF